MIFIDIRILIFQSLQTWFFPSEFHSKIWHFGRKTQLKNRYFWFSHRNPNCFEKSKKFKSKELSRYSKSYFSVTTGENSPPKFSIENFFSGGGFKYQTFWFDWRIRFVKVQKFQKVLFIVILLDIQTCIPLSL